uniref:TSC22 domain family, member 1 n=1 Tax=Mola mola TaxID=94237 RepID=A0A3Q3WEZ7_MOLML
MHHPDPVGDSGSVRKMAHSAVFHRRGSNTVSGSGSALSTPANPVVSNSHVPADNYQPSLLIQCQPPAGSSSPGPHHIPPHSLNLHSQPQPTQSAGAQIKKRSGFQITSVTPAQISVSTNNSIAEDTESYDDLDESHTEDLSSSEILDASLSRANDIVGAERSSSEETLNNFHDAETPGAVSPNQPSHPHILNQAQQCSGSVVNGTVHHQHAHHPNHAQVYPLSSVPGSPSSALASGALPCVTQKMPSNMGVPSSGGFPHNVLSSSGGSAGGGGPVTAPVTALATAPVPSTPVQPATAPTPAVATTSSRFRVVKLDSNSEPFKKGRWTCTEFYDKETPASAPSSSACDTGSVSMRQFTSESFAGTSERDNTSGSSVSSTLSHYNDIVCGGEPGGPAGPHMGVSQTQTHIHPQDITHSQAKTTVAPSAPSNILQPTPMSGHPTTIGLSSTAVHQQLTYAQAVANQPTGSSQGLVGVKQQKMSYATQLQQPSANPQAASMQGKPSEYPQPHQGMPQGAGSKPVSNQAGSAASGPANGACQMMEALQQSQALLHTQSQQSSSLQASTSSMPSHFGGASGLAQQPQSHPGHHDCQQNKPQSLPTQIQNQGLGTQLPTTVYQSQGSAPSVPPPNPQSDPQAPPGNSGRMHPQGVSQIQSVSLAQDHSNAQALAHAAQASALYASLPTFTTTQLQDAQRLLLQHQSALLGLPKLSGGDAVSGISISQGQDAEGNSTATSALSASAGIKTVDGDEDG